MRYASISALILSSSLAGCAETPKAVSPTGPTVVVPAPSTTAAPASFPERVDDLATLVPAEAPWVVELPDPAKAVTALPPGQAGLAHLLVPMFAGDVATLLGAERDAVGDVMDGFGASIAFGDAHAAAVVARVGPREAVEKILAGSAFEKADAGELTAASIVVRARELEGSRLAWYPKAGLLVVATSEALAVAAQRLAIDHGKSFAEASVRLPPSPSAIRAYGDLAALARGVAELRGVVDAGSSVRLDVAEIGKRSKLELQLVGARVPRLGAVFDAHAPALALRLPEETILFSSTSLARKPKKTIRDAIDELSRAAPAAPAAEMLAQKVLGESIEGLDAYVGSELVGGVVIDPARKLDKSAGDRPLDAGALVLLFDARDEDHAKKILAAAKKGLDDASIKQRFTLTAKPGALRLDPKPSAAKPAAKGVAKPASAKGPAARGGADEYPVRIEAHKNVVLVAYGAPAWMDRAARALDKGEKTLADAQAFASSRAEIGKPSNNVVWFDSPRLAPIVGAGMVGAAARSRLTLGDSDRGLALVVDGENGAETAMLGTSAALAIYGVRRYLQNAKTAEAKNTVGAIAREAVMAYERETMAPTSVPTSGAFTTVHALCNSAKPVPAKVPAGVKYQPSDRDGVDYRTGDATTGWSCLKFEMTSPQYYQYEYRHGGPYKGPARGGPDPGKDGFEISAEGDLDGNGKTSLFTITGTIDKKSGAVKLTPLFVVDELE